MAKTFVFFRGYDIKVEYEDFILISSFLLISIAAAWLLNLLQTETGSLWVNRGSLNLEAATDMYLWHH